MDELPIEVGRGRSSTGPTVSLGGRRPGRFIIGALVVVVALAVVLGSRRSSNRVARTTTTIPATTSAAVSTSVNVSSTTVAPTTTVAPVTTLAQRTVSELGGQLLASRTGTELIVHGFFGLVRIDLDRGQVIRTPVPFIASTDPTFMIVGPRSVLLRPQNSIGGYLIPDTGVAQPVTGRLAEGTGWAYPGPIAGSVWVQSNNPPGGQLGFELVGFDADFAPVSIGLVNLYPWGPDGTGQVVVTGTGGVYVTTGAGFTRITTGDLFAAGPTTWLVRECDDHHLCSLVIIDRKTGHRHPLNAGSLADDPGPLKGMINADGTAAWIFHNQSGALDVLNLVTGAAPNVAATILPVDPVWSLDGRYLFFTPDKLHLWVFDRVTETQKELQGGGDNVDELATRSATP